VERPTNIAQTVEHVLQKVLKQWNACKGPRVSKGGTFNLYITPSSPSGLRKKHPTKNAETVDQASKIGGSMVSDQKVRVHSRDSRAKAFCKKLQKPWNRANLSEFQNLRSRPGSELPKKMLTPWLSNS